MQSLLFGGCCAVGCFWRIPVGACYDIYPAPPDKRVLSSTIAVSQVDNLETRPFRG